MAHRSEQNCEHNVIEIYFLERLHRWTTSRANWRFSIPLADIVLSLAEGLGGPLTERGQMRPSPYFLNDHRIARCDFCHRFAINRFPTTMLLESVIAALAVLPGRCSQFWSEWW